MSVEVVVVREELDAERLCVLDGTESVGERRSVLQGLEGRLGIGRDGTGRNGRDGTGRDGTGRDGTGRDGTGRAVFDMPLEELSRRRPRTPHDSKSGQISQCSRSY